MAARYSKIGGKFEGEQYDVLQDKGDVVLCRFYRVNKQGVLIGMIDSEVPKRNIAFSKWVAAMGGEERVKYLAMAHREVELRAKSIVGRKGNGKANSRPF